MSHNPNPNVDNSGFNYPSAAGKATNTDQTHVGIMPTANSSTAESSSSVPMTTTYPTQTHIGPSIDIHHGQLGGEHGGSGTRTDDRKGETVKNEGDTTTSTAQHTDPNS
ncbi:unnamed protein product [Adineta steineri]|uniref:Uncharacterized protein n=1 Tax=Adineta steineri TaxID=433720 RepID=A0A814I5S2_9BILA|nr:unnamed protein product [Adineta steineri]CAF1465887.1 unnamed protein product [Adineta steineri]